ncbi:unnamed protein product [Notodromas monacha]|uniref:BTB domain-containing protein n=1 Tax=Notodromas monacha TaxID=399045 RepID=A0A7R9GC13_9CRUS|nr:unnamed protein product [Notodromas monacha]CAG0915371.1 unnamed protein product [Notodromas monacha]
MSMVTPMSYCIRWGKHPMNISSASCNLFNSQMLVDVTLAADGVQIQAHKLVLAASSVYFQALFTQNPCQHPIVILKDVSIDELRIIIDFVYKGEVEVPDDKLSSVLKVGHHVSAFIKPNDGSHEFIGWDSFWEHFLEYEPVQMSSPDAPESNKRKATACVVADAEPVSPAVPSEANMSFSQSQSFSSTSSATPRPVLETVPFRKRLRKEFRERSLSGDASVQLFPERSTSMVAAVRSTSQIENTLLPPETSRPPMQTQTSDPGPMRSFSIDRSESPVPSYASKHRRMLQRQPRIQRQMELEAEDSTRKYPPIKPRPTIIVTQDDETKPREVICTQKLSPERDLGEQTATRSPDSDSSARDLSIDEGVVSRSCPPSPPAKIIGRSSSTSSHRERRKKMHVVFLSSPEPAVVVTSPASGHHCPESRVGSAVSCDYCWNKMDDKGRVQRRKTKYWCPKCRANLCIVPCFQQYHNFGGVDETGVNNTGSDTKTRGSFERSSSLSSSCLLAVPKNLSKTPSV